jgi:dipeptidyl aminopeptidase/acylaminoacyl peptidase
MRFGEKEAVRLTNNHASDRCPRWSPDGRRIAYLSTEPGLPKVCITDCKGSQPLVLQATDPIPSDRGATLDWSPDGAEIAFIGDMGRAIRIVNVSAGTVHTLVDGELSDGCANHFNLCWKKADNLILVNSQSAASFYQQGIFHLNPKTRKVGRITLNSEDAAFLIAPVASPDGSRFAAPQYPGGDRPLRRIYLTTPDAAPQYCLVGDDVKVQMATRWSADGKLLAYSAAPEDRYHVYLVDSRDKESIQLTSGDYDDIEPDVYGSLDTVLSAINRASMDPQFRNLLGEKALGTAVPVASKKGATLERFQRALGTQWDKLSLADKKRTELAWRQLSENERAAVYRIYAEPREVRKEMAARLTIEERKQLFEQITPPAEVTKWVKSSCPWVNLNDLSEPDRLLLAWAEMTIRAIVNAAGMSQGH